MGIFVIVAAALVIMGLIIAFGNADPPGTRDSFGNGSRSVDSSSNRRSFEYDSRSIADQILALVDTCPKNSQDGAFDKNYLYVTGAARLRRTLERDDRFIVSIGTKAGEWQLSPLVSPNGYHGDYLQAVSDLLRSKGYKTRKFWSTD